ncbi:NifB/NifX family molybdenum-iron cluster-binding protein [Thermosphaera chiliense]|uniref:NifB/NifX family molybdenum-iron cluster-binding protein n=1 Tax=Thermosphaera chiliense TaxID=3402707 RepID=A0A7M1URU4_9CREN|nr:NifB/NifX family molybdenum-iron cluster-binding protein [Thermosphaera aggregans]QOR94756.1 NifB/NifX family molybdenum-iron cluster-binding protein [Thermosphaera aggregans]
MSSESSSIQPFMVAAPVVKVGSEYYLTPHFGRAPFFAIVQVAGNDYRILEIIENPHVRHEHGRGSRVIEMLTSRGVDSVIVLGIGYGAFRLLRESGVKIYYVPVEGATGSLVPLGKAVEMFVNKQLEEALEPRELD